MLRHAAVYLVVAAVLAGCSVPNTPPTAAPPPADAVRVTTYAPGQSLVDPGLCFLNAATGQTECWSATDERNSPEAPGGPWVLVRPYLYNRGSKASFDLTGYTLDAATADVLLLRHTGTRTYTVAGPDLKPLRTLELAVGEHEAAWLSPDGRWILYNPWPWGQTPRTGPLLQLVSVETGAATPVAVPSDLPAGQIAGLYLATLPGHFAVRIDLLRDGQPFWALYRFDWTGRQTAALTGAGAVEGVPAFAPDGSRVALRQVLHSFASATTVYDLNSGKPLFRVLGAFPGGWMADGSALLLEAPRAYHLVSSSGQLRESSLSALGASHGPLHPVPAHRHAARRWRLDPDSGEGRAGAESDGLRR